MTWLTEAYFLRDQQNTHTEQEAACEPAHFRPLAHTSLTQGKFLAQPGDQKDGPKPPAGVDHIDFGGHAVTGNGGGHEHSLQGNQPPTGPNPAIPRHVSAKKSFLLPREQKQREDAKRSKDTEEHTHRIGLMTEVRNHGVEQAEGGR